MKKRITAIPSQLFYSKIKKALLCYTIGAFAFSACQRKQAGTVEKNLETQQKALPKEDIKDSLCVVVYETETKEWLKDSQTYHALTVTEIAKINKIFKDFWKSGGGDSTLVYTLDPKTEIVDSFIRIRKPLPYDRYYKQLIGYEENGNTMVFIYLFSSERASRENTYHRLKETVVQVADGGISFGEAMINLTTGKIVRFSLNGEG